ncbi:MAG: penicillin-binding protein 2 [Verrucomicrobiota bacterium]
MTRTHSSRRLLCLSGIFCLALVGLGFRLAFLQVFQHDELQIKAKQNTQRLIAHLPLRGQIRDIRNVPLAVSEPAKKIIANPTLIGSRNGEMAHLLAPFLKMDETLLAQKIQPRVIGYKTNGEAILDQYVVLKNKVPLKEWEQIQEALSQNSFGLNEAGLKGTNKLALNNLRHKAISTEEDQLRIYPNQSLAAHVLGYVGSGDADEFVGRTGVEFSMQSKLNGVRGWRRTEIDKRSREIVAYRDQEVEAHDGLNIVLTLDAGLQNIVESELAEAMTMHSPLSVSAIVVRPRTGEILAMASLPTFNPNHPGGNLELLKNRMITDVAEPGSTFKIVVVSGGLNDNIIRLTDQFDCENGHFLYGGKTLHDHHRYGILSVKEIITKSSNIGAAKIGIKLGDDRLYDYIRDFGFGARTGIPLTGESGGILYPPAKWSKVSIAQIPMGHGLAVTPLQMVMAMSAIANEGRLMRPMLINRLEDDSGKIVAQYEPQLMREVITTAAAKEMVTALKTVVGEDGTAAKARLEHYTVAGKTGTAQKAEHGVYSNTKFFASFIGFFPADHPEICISIVMDEPKGEHFGGQTAAPFFKKIAERAANYLNIEPDIAPQPDDKPAFTANR